MANHKQLFPDKRTSNRGGLAKYNADLDQYVSERIEAASTEFYEIEAFEVTETSSDVYGGVKGVFVEDESQSVKGFGKDEDVVISLKPNITQIPLIGEHVSVIEFNNKHYYIEIEMISHDRVTDGHFTVESKCRLQFHHNSIWFAELNCDGDDSNYNKNHFFGYLKLQELGYELPDKPQW